MEIFESTTFVTILVLVLMFMVVMLLMTTISLSLSVHRLKKKYKIFMRGNDGATLEKMFSDKMKSIDFIENQIAKDQAIMDQIKTTQEKTLNHYGIVKYDAFDDVGGKMSFALANLDKNHTGYILNAVHSRDNCFLYLKEVVKGESYIMLSTEEIEALNRAVNSDLENDI